MLYGTIRGLIVRPIARVLYRLDVHGAELIPQTGPCILASNHESLVDPFALALATRRQVRFLAKVELFENRLSRALLDDLGAIPVSRGKGDREALALARSFLDRGDVLGVFPQGTCRPYRERPWRRGAARLAFETGSPIVPVCLVNTERALRPHDVRMGLPKVRVLVGPPIEVEQLKPTIVAAQALMERVEQAVLELRRPYGEPAHAWIERPV